MASGFKARLNADKQFEIAAARSEESVTKVKQKRLRSSTSRDWALENPQPRTDRRQARARLSDREPKQAADGQPDRRSGRQSRINPSGVKEVAVRQYGSDQIEVIVP